MFGFNRPFVSRRRYVATHPGDPDYDEDEEFSDSELEAAQEIMQENFDDGPDEDEPEIGDGPHHVDDRGWP